MVRKVYERIAEELQCLQISVCKQNGAYVNSEYKSKEKLAAAPRPI